MNNRCCKNLPSLPTGGGRTPPTRLGSKAAQKVGSRLSRIKVGRLGQVGLPVGLGGRLPSDALAPSVQTFRRSSSSNVGATLFRQPMRNYRFFFMFVSSTAVLCLYVFVFCWVHIKKIMDSYHCNLWRAVMRSPISGVLIIFTFIGSWFVGGLTAFHFYLICTNQTTYENFKYRYDGKMNPYNRGCFRNVWEIFFSRIPKSKNDFRAKVKEDLPPFSSSLSYGRALSLNTSKASFDLEMGTKRQAVDAEEFEDIQSQIESVGGGERCSTQLPHSSWGSRKGSWEITSDLDALAVEFGMGHGYTDR